MTPVEIFEYKQRWAPGYQVALHSDLVDKAKTWCRRNLSREQWSMTSWTDVYEHTFHFEIWTHAESFAEQWPDFVNNVEKK